MDLLTLGALAVLVGVILFIKPKAKTATATAPVQGASSEPVRHAGHVFYDAFKALEESAIADHLKEDFGAKGAAAFSDKLAGYTGKPTVAPVPNSPPATP